MNKLLKTILIISIAIFGATLLLVLPTNAQADELVVEYWTGTEWKPLVDPLFEETNFLPGQDVTRLVRVTNNSNSSQGIATEAIKVSDPDRLGDVLVLEITEDSETRYKDDLSRFFNKGEAYLSDLASGDSTTYNFSIGFYPGTGNTFQGKTLGFDILIGFQGEEGGLPPGSGGGGGGFLPPGLTISNEADQKVTENSVTITWLTSYKATSQVVYDTILGQFDLSAGPTNYGYADSKEGDDTGIEKVTGHSVTITGLTPGKIYYYRCVSHGSLAIGTEHTFTTLVGTGEEEVEEEIEEEEEEEMPGPVIPSEEGEEGEKPEEITEGITEGEGAGVGEITFVEDEEEVLTEEGKGVVSWLSGGLASMIDALKGIGEQSFLYLIIILILIFITLILLYLLLKRKKKKEEDKNKSGTINLKT